MVKFRGKPKHKKTAAEVSAEAHVYSAPHHFRPFSFLKNIPRRQIQIFGIVVLLIILIIGAVLYKTVGPGKHVLKGISEKQGYQNYLSKLEANRPKASAPKLERAQYYRSLAVTKADVKDYKGAVAAFNTGVKIDPALFNYIDYMYLAGYYHKLGEKGSADEALDKAVNLLPPSDNPDTGFYRTEQIKVIDNFRKQYSS